MYYGNLSVGSGVTGAEASQQETVPQGGCGRDKFRDNKTEYRSYKNTHEPRGGRRALPPEVQQP